jgi:hypothetical protein
MPHYIKAIIISLLILVSLNLLLLYRSYDTIVRYIE